MYVILLQVGGPWKTYNLSRDYKIRLPVDLDPVSLTWFLIM